MDKDEIISKLGWFTQMKSIPPLTDKFKTEQIIFFEISSISYKIMD